ncbi:DUF4197 domain-containing protein [Paracnuella aquatica]|uniref:DUF4197 domain-containing protein n=1 Tax=Paracnuella aquatica TaxID=2268757 RepID=UPI000DEFC72D|nr:DUF4197 domain-containing protein [Paracnuella aquatica]RPD46700.1 DUF4197 domain-containing protein [Paracnuella aquatica]
MKKQSTIALLFLFSVSTASAQLGNVLKKNTGSKDSTTLSKVSGLFKKGGAASALSSDEIAAGLKQALEVGAERGTSLLSAPDGFFKNAALKILMPEDAKKVESTLRNVGLGKQVDAAILSMNRAAEDAAKNATPIFVDAIHSMTLNDAMGILKGGDFAATEFLKSKTSVALMAAFKPVIDQSLAKVDATKHWTTLTTTYNRFSRERVETDLNQYVAQKALAGIFQQLSLEEQKIRKNPAARSTDLLKKVFAQ